MRSEERRRTNVSTHIASEEVTLRLKRIDMTQTEFDALPEE